MKTAIWEKYRWIIILAAVGIMLLIVSFVLPKQETGEQTCDDPELKYYYTSVLEERIKQLLESCDGVDGVCVLLTLDCTSEYVYAENSSVSESSVSKDILLADGKSGSAPVPVSEIYPKIRGVAVVCSRGNESEIKAKITDLLCASLGISSNRVRVSG